MSNATGAVKRYARDIPKEYMVSIDTILMFLITKSIGDIQNIAMRTTDARVHIAAILLYNTVVNNDIDGVALIFKRLAGPPLSDVEQIKRLRKKPRQALSS